MLTTLLLSAALMQTPAVVKNPTIAEFTCPDHDVDTQHELKVIRIEGTNKVIITTILLGDPAYKDPATKLVSAGINLQPIAFGDYIATVNVVVPTATGVLRSDDSFESNPFQRAPGAPARVIIK
jgi:hypothetical protein